MLLQAALQGAQKDSQLPGEGTETPLQHARSAEGQSHHRMGCLGGELGSSPAPSRGSGGPEMLPKDMWYVMCHLEGLGQEQEAKVVAAAESAAPGGWRDNYSQAFSRSNALSNTPLPPVHKKMFDSFLTCNFLDGSHAVCSFLPSQQLSPWWKQYRFFCSVPTESNNYIHFKIDDNSETPQNYKKQLKPQSWKVLILHEILMIR